MTDQPTGDRSRKIADYLPLIQAADGLTLGQVCKLGSLEPSTVQNWIKRGYAPHPTGKKYHERHLARILLIAELRESMQIDRIGALLCYINGDADDESDDIISEEALYDLFRDIADAAEQKRPSPDNMRDVVAECVARSFSGDSAAKLTNALEIMALAYTANIYKRGADSLFNRYLSDREVT